MFSATLPLFKFSPDNSNAYPTFNKATYQHYLNPTSIAKAGSISREDIKRGDRENRRRGVEEGFIHMLHLMRARSSWKQGLGLGLLVGALRLQQHQLESAQRDRERCFPAAEKLHEHSTNSKSKRIRERE